METTTHYQELDALINLYAEEEDLELNSDIDSDADEFLSLDNGETRRHSLDQVYMTNTSEEMQWLRDPSDLSPMPLPRPRSNSDATGNKSLDMALDRFRQIKMEHKMRNRSQHAIALVYEEKLKYNTMRLSAGTNRSSKVPSFRNNRSKSNRLSLGLENPDYNMSWNFPGMPINFESELLNPDLIGVVSEMSDLDLVSNKARPAESSMCSEVSTTTSIINKWLTYNVTPDQDDTMSEFDRDLDLLGADATIFDEKNSIVEARVGDLPRSSSMSQSSPLLMLWSSSKRNSILKANSREIEEESPHPPKALMSATLVQLIKILTTELDYTFMSDFFLTYRLFVGPDELLRLLMARYRWALASQEEQRLVVRVRMFVVLRHWLINYYKVDFAPSLPLRSGLANAILALERSQALFQSPRDKRILREIKGIMCRLTPSSTSYYLVTTPLDEACQFWGADLTHAEPAASTASDVSTTADINSESNASPPQSPVSLPLPSSMGASSTSVKTPPGIHCTRTADAPMPHPSAPLPVNPTIRKLASWKRLKGILMSDRIPSIHDYGSNKEAQASNLKPKPSLTRLLAAAKASVPTQAPRHLVTPFSSSSNTKLESRLIQESLKHRVDPPISRLPQLGLIDHVPVLGDRVPNLKLQVSYEEPAPSTKKASKKRRDNSQGRWLELGTTRYKNPFASRARCFVLDYPSEAVAQQLCQIEAQLLLSVNWEELVDKFFPQVSPVAPPVESRSISGLVSRFNHVSEWAILELTRCPDVVDQVKLITKFIKIAQKSYQLANFATLVQLLLALQAPRVAELKMAWGRVGEHELRWFKELVQFTNPIRNWKQLRSAMASIAEAWGEATDGVPKDTAAQPDSAGGNNNSHRLFQKPIGTFSSCQGGDPEGPRIDSSSDDGSVKPPKTITGCVPFMGLYLSDLLHLAELPTMVTPQPTIQLRHQSLPVVNPPLSCIPVTHSQSAPSIVTSPSPPSPQVSIRLTPSISQSFMDRVINLDLDLDLNLPSCPKEHTPTSKIDPITTPINFHKFRSIGKILKRFQTFKRLANNYAIEPFRSSALQEKCIALLPTYDNISPSSCNKSFPLPVGDATTNGSGFTTSASFLKASVSSSQYS